MLTYTLGPALRTPDVKNLGTDLAPEELRTCPWVAREAPQARLFGGFSGATKPTSVKSRALRAPPMHFFYTSRDFALTDRET